MKAFLVAYDFRGLQKISELKIVKFGYVRGCLKLPVTQIWSLEILGVNIHSRHECMSAHTPSCSSWWIIAFQFVGPCPSREDPCIVLLNQNMVIMSCSYLTPFTLH
jgi:hypothetical protein